MTQLNQVDGAAFQALTEHVSRLKHDLGKYIAMQQRWLPEDAGPVARREALTTDLLHTRRGTSGTVDALTVWREFRPALVGAADLPGGIRVDLSEHPLLRALDTHMAMIAEVTLVLRDNAATEAEVETGRTAALAVSDTCRELARAIRTYQRR